MICAEILQRYGFVPIVPNRGKPLGTPQSKAQSHVPVVPSVPARKYKSAGATRYVDRPILHFRLVDSEPNAWATGIGKSGESVEALHDELRTRFGAFLAEVRRFDPNGREHE